MSKKGDSNVLVADQEYPEGAEAVEGRVLVSIPINKVVPDPEFPNIRGVVGDTTELQASIREVGVLMPILVRVSPEEPGVYFLIAGARRTAAAKKVGLNTIPAVIDGSVEPRLIRRMMLASDVRKDHPHIVLDAAGKVVGGSAWAVYLEVEEGAERKELAPLMGVSQDVVGAFYCLYGEIPEIQQRVIKGDLGITVYSLMKHAPEDFRRYAAAKRGRISAGWVRKKMGEWDDIKDDLDEGGEPAEKPEPAEYVDVHEVLEEHSPSFHLNVARVSLSSVNKGDLGESDWSIVEEIEVILNRLRRKRVIKAKIKRGG